MKAWTIQWYHFWENLKKQGNITNIPEFWDEFYGEDEKSFYNNNYQWLMDQMDQRGLKKPRKLSYPIYFWIQWKNTWKRKPDLRHYVWDAQKNMPYIRIECDIPEENILIFNHDNWCRTFQNGYLPDSIEDFDTYWENLKNIEALSTFQYPLKQGKFYELQSKIVKSWEKIFDLNYNVPDDSVDPKKKQEQRVIGTVWKIDLDWVTDVTHFNGRNEHNYSWEIPEKIKNKHLSLSEIC